MGNFEIKSKILTTRYEFRDENVTVKGSYESGVDGKNVQVVRGDVTLAGNDREYIGNFTGTPDSNGEMEYTLSKMSRSKKNMTWAAIDAIEMQLSTIENGEGGDE